MRTAAAAALLFEEAAPLLRHNPRLDEVIVLPREEWQALWRARRLIALLRSVIAFRAALRARRFDPCCLVRRKLLEVFYHRSSFRGGRIGNRLARILHLVTNISAFYCNCHVFWCVT
jgi:ADP-heptose:LPS heptosyltransferase